MTIESSVLPKIPYLRLRARLRSRENARLPAYKGSMLRGAFGHALRRAVCAMGRGSSCDGCSLSSACVYARLFEPFAEVGGRSFVGGLPAAPQPYVFEPHESARAIEAGGLLRFDLLQFGQAVELHAFAVMAIQRMAAGGLGARRHRFRLEDVRYQDSGGDWHLGYRRGARRWPARLEPVLPAGVGLDAEAHRLRFLSPTRIKVRRRLLDAVDFPTLAFKMLRRTLEMAHFHGPEETVAWDGDELLERAAGVRVVESRLSWQDWDRYSNRQRGKMKLGGFVGDLVVEGDLAPFAPLLRTAEVIHVGKGATFGLGKMDIQPV